MSKSDNTLVKITHDHGPLGFISFLAYIGAVVYFVQQSPGFWGFVGALFEAIVWPAFVVYHVMVVLHV